MVQDPTWVNLVVEEALEPGLAICDPHHHLWIYRESDHLRDHQYLLNDLLNDLSGGHNIKSTVAVECRAEFLKDGPPEMRPIGETRFVAELTEECQSGDGIRVAAGIVGSADLDLGDAIRPVLEAQIEAGRGRFRGIRHTASWDASDAVRNGFTNPPPGLYLDRVFREGFAHLEQLGLTFEAWCYHPQLLDVASLARSFPNTTIIMNHLGGPLGIGPYSKRRAEVFAQWQNGLTELAACPNVHIKLGGIQMDVNGFGWEDRVLPPTSEELVKITTPYHLHAIEKFGVDRAMFQGNYPVDKLSCGYTVLWNSFKLIVSDASPEEKAKLFHDNATCLYHLEDQGSG